MIDQPTVLRIEKIVAENPRTKTFVFKHKLNAKPGQYVMVWLPGIGEKPISVGYQDKDKFAITVCCVGEFSEAMCKLKEGDKVGIRGPYGTFYKIEGYAHSTNKSFRSRNLYVLGRPKKFECSPRGHTLIALGSERATARAEARNVLCTFIEGKNICLVAGGYGAAPMAFLADIAREKGINVHYIVGAKTKNLLLFEDRMFKAGVNVHIATDDGSKGVKGFATDVLKKVLQMEKFDKIFTCGPEIMMKKVVELSGDIPCELSLERYLKCGIGVCGSCCVDPLGICMCNDGPVIDKEIAQKITEFGRYKRDASGKKVKC